MRIPKEECVGLVIDIQEKLFPVVFDKDEFLTNSKRLILGLQELGIPLITTQQYSKGLGETLVEVSTLISHFNPIEKVSFSCYDEPGFVENLESKDKKIGYIPVVVGDCTSSRSKSNIKLAIERFCYENIMVTSMESILFELTRSASDPAFKTISRLVK